MVKVRNTEEVVIESVGEEKKKGNFVKLLVKLPSRDEDGNKTTIKFEGEGTVEEAVEAISLPKNLAVNIELTLIKGGVELLRNITAIKAKAIFSFKDVGVLRGIFRGLI